MSTNLNVAPYYDDFDETKGFQQIVFKPGYAVQARELTQMQSIIKDQIAKFGNHIFQHGSVVIPGNSFFDNSVPYVKVATISAEAKALLLQASINSVTLVGTTGGARAVIKKVVDSTSTDPLTLYVGFTKGNSFANSETLQIDGTVYTLTLPSSEATGLGSMAFVNKGVYYVNGEFGLILGQSVITSKYTSTPSCKVLVKTSSTIVSSDQDETLLDPAQGSYNFSAPGADRIKLFLELTTATIEETVSTDCFELMRLEDGILITHARNAKYSELEKTFARRTYDESGNYVVNGFDVSLIEHKKTQINGGYSATGSIDNFVVRMTGGKAYVGGYEQERLTESAMVLPKARDASHQKEGHFSSTFAYGISLYAADLKKVPDFQELEVITFYDTSGAGGTAVATAKAIFADYEDGAGTSTIYKLALTDLVYIGANTIDNIGGFRAEAVGGSGAVGSIVKKINVNNVSGIFVASDVLTVPGSTKTATVVYSDPSVGALYIKKHTSANLTPDVGNIVSGSLSSATASTIASKNQEVAAQNVFMIPVAVQGLKTLKNLSNAFVNNYKVWKTFDITTNGSGNGSFTITQGEFDNLETSAFIAASTSGQVSISLFSVSGDGKTLSITAGPTSTLISIQAVVLSENSTPKTKTLMNGSKTVGAGLATNSIQLDHADIVRITSVIVNSVDVTPNWQLDNGQRDFYYQKGVLNRIFGVLPSAEIVINYTYYEHSVGGDFFTLDSYPADIDLPSYKSKSTNITYQLRNMIDFRKKWDPATGIDGALNAPVQNSRFETDYVKYLPRVDVISMTKTGSISITQGTPSETPRAPKRSGESMDLYALIIPAYTPYVQNIQIVKLYTPGYTMQEIDDIQKRINRIEQYITATDAEQELIQREIPDALTGLNKFKTGYLVETFRSPLNVAHSTHPEFNVAYFGARAITAGKIIYGPTVQFAQMSGLRNTNGLITLDYIERILIDQNQSTRVTNVNPFMTFSWVGNMTITPQNYTWTTTDWRSAIVNDVTQVIDNIITIQEPDVMIPWSEPVIAPAPQVTPQGAPSGDVIDSMFVQSVGGPFNSLEFTTMASNSVLFQTTVGELIHRARAEGVDIDRRPLNVLAADAHGTGGAELTGDPNQVVWIGSTAQGLGRVVDPSVYGL